MRLLLPFLFAIGFAFVFETEQAPQLTIHLIGDSTMADKPGTPDENPERGWGQLLHTFFTDEIAVRNYAVNGRSSKSFIDEGRWDEVMNQLRAGDYVFMQFGHNDQKHADPKRYTNPWTSYRRNLEKFIQDSRSKGAIPVVLSSIVRRKFNEAGTLIDTHGVYPFVAREAAENLEAIFIDMQLMTEELVMDLGVEKSKEIYLWVPAGKYDKFPDGREDNTHLTLHGATTYAGLVATAIEKQQLLPLAHFLK